MSQVKEGYKKMSFILKNDLVKSIKIRALEKDKTMTDIVDKALRYYLENVNDEE